MTKFTRYSNTFEEFNDAHAFSVLSHGAERTSSGRPDKDRVVFEALG